MLLDSSAIVQRQEWKVVGKRKAKEVKSIDVHAKLPVITEITTQATVSKK